ncbi:hypothetical protein DEO72_LG7g1700 [Vigna unguiculata]|uniref:Uncharacterized protein n=1 Tax=Vigna unguiculata TaxID=3917 RepID=A0A4D6MG40_VIGUN|nr:hypothetical protein DEO72_LG7g1700 [Vigna unguiculata]
MKTIIAQLLEYRLVASYAPLGDGVRIERTWSLWRLAVGIVPPSDSGKVNVYKGAWRLAVCVTHQAVWRPDAPGA